MMFFIPKQVVFIEFRCRRVEINGASGASKIFFIEFLSIFIEFLSVLIRISRF